MGWTRRGFLAGGLVLAGCSAQGDLSAGEQGRVARVLEGDALALDTGLRVRLVEVEAPAPGYDGRVDEPWAAEAKAVLEAAAVGRQAQLWYGGLSRDSYERALAHVIVRDEVGGEVWLNGLVVRQGGGRVRTYNDNARRARRLLALEVEARAAKRGLWADAHWRVRGLDDLEGAPNFAIVEGEIASLGEMAGDGEAHLSRGGIRLDVGERLGLPDVELAVGARVRVRGRIDTREGEAKIRVSHWAQVEVV
ncbi:MAG: thermonuclease family protein [Hyphomonadaceae bacterium]|nr:thermonuclease family protein [Hyphomonadaceae bacterium]